MNYTRVLKKGMFGDDVKYMQSLLTKLGHSLGAIDGDFGSKTEAAVKAFQKHNLDSEGKMLVVDGIIGKKTWDSIVDRANKLNILNSFPNIFRDNLLRILADLNDIDGQRRKIVLDALSFAYDPSGKTQQASCPHALYVFGENLYDSSKNINYATAAKIEAAAKKYPNYFTGGRKEWMLEQVKKNPKLPASDCSGFIVGLLRKHGLVGNTFDDSANNLCSSKYSRRISKSELKPGDWVGKSGHIGMYVGGGFVVEFYGGEYGCQLTPLNLRNGWGFISKAFIKGSNWTNYNRPKYY